jgi:hypothetical protein
MTKLTKGILMPSPQGCGHGRQRKPSKNMYDGKIRIMGGAKAIRFQGSHD